MAPRPSPTKPSPPSSFKRMEVVGKAQPQPDGERLRRGIVWASSQARKPLAQTTGASGTPLRSGVVKECDSLTSPSPTRQDLAHLGKAWSGISKRQPFSSVLRQAQDLLQGTLRTPTSVSAPPITPKKIQQKRRGTSFKLVPEFQRTSFGISSQRRCGRKDVV